MLERFGTDSLIPYPQEAIVNVKTFSTQDNLVKGKKPRYLGSIYTPPDFTKFLTSWAIRNSEDKILDVGIGEGAFIFESYRRLLALGAKATNAQQQLYGAEIDTLTYNKFSELTDIYFPNLLNTDFFKVEFPLVDVVVGNPPYVRRAYIENIDEIRQSVTQRNLLIKDIDINRTTDLYIYFLLRALPMLKIGGRVAVITADPWLNVGYGEGFKKYLQSYFKIESLISLDKGVFSDAEVKPILLLATKKETVDLNSSVHFIRVKNGLSITSLQRMLEQPDTKSNDVIFSEIKGNKLNAASPWSVHFKVPEFHKEITSHNLMTSISNIAETRIGIQTLAKDFFVLTSEQVEATKIEAEFLVPLAQSLRYFNKPTIEAETNPSFYLFYCSSSKKDLQGTQALNHILLGETSPVRVRGKNVIVIGYHNKERIKTANRKLWYDLKTPLEVRGRSSILIPRLIYHNFKVIWNKAKFVPGELFIEFIPRATYDDEVYLAILNSSISEISLRAHAQVYGGGTYNISPGEIKNTPILNIELLTNQQRAILKQAYLEYLSDANHNRSVIDREVYNILGWNDSRQIQMKMILDDLLTLASSSKKVGLDSSLNCELQL